MAQNPYERVIFHRNTTLRLQVMRARRKTMAIHVLAEGIEVRVPLKCPWNEIDAFIESRLDWLVSAKEQVGQDLPAAKFLDGERQEYLGRNLPLKLSAGASNAVTAIGDTIEIRSKQPECHQYNQGLFFKFLRKQSLAWLPVRVRELESIFPEVVTSTRVRIRRMRARWGSCSETGEICLNSMLMQKDPRAIDLVINHELCHLKHFHHDKPFYALLDRAMPEWRAFEKLLSATPGAPRTPSEQLSLF